MIHTYPISVYEYDTDTLETDYVDCTDLVSARR